MLASRRCIPKPLSCGRSMPSAITGGDGSGVICGLKCLEAREGGAWVRCGESDTLLVMGGVASPTVFRSGVAAPSLKSWCSAAELLLDRTPSDELAELSQTRSCWIGGRDPRESAAWRCGGGGPAGWMGISIGGAAPPSVAAMITLGGAERVRPRPSIALMLGQSLGLVGKMGALYPGDERAFLSRSMLSSVRPYRSRHRATPCGAAVLSMLHIGKAEDVAEEECSSSLSALALRFRPRCACSAA